MDNQGKSIVLHISNFSNSSNPERELLIDINQELLKYDFSIGWYSTGVAKYHEDTQEYLDGVDSDLATLHNRCLANDVDSIVDFNSVGIPYIRGQKHIDLHSVYGKPMVQTTIFKNAYRTLKLDEVSKAVLSDNINSGKIQRANRNRFSNSFSRRTEKYVLKDAKLVMQLSQHNNSEVLDAMKAISELTGLDFERGLQNWTIHMVDCYF